MNQPVSFLSGTGALVSGTGHNPDILTCLANLSADEVFTPPKFANAMLDTLPVELWSDPNATFLDPCTKSGVFLREIARRLNDGLAAQMPDDQKRIDHILTKQVFGMATGELTWLLARRSVYCTKKANGKYSVASPGTFKTAHGNILYPRKRHTWNKQGRCIYCGANKENYDRDESREAYAYPFIHGSDPTKEFNMKFDVIVGNPPYQLSDGGHGRSASPIYNKFVEQAKNLQPRYLTMVIPSRWFSGGKGLDEFRTEMLNDRRLRCIVDYENFNEAFPGVDVAGGVLYFLWDRDSEGDCEITNLSGDQSVTTTRPLNEFGTFIRSGNAIPIVKKVIEKHGETSPYLKDKVSPSKPFGLRGNYPPQPSGTPCWFKQSIGLSFASPNDLKDDHGLLGKWKVLIPKAPIAGQTDFTKPVRFYYEQNVRIAKPGEACTEIYLVAGAFDTKRESESFKSYLFTKVARFLLLQTVMSQDVTRKNFAFVPDLGNYIEDITDSYLLERWGISAEEWNYIDSKIGD